jgi:hypothetical protein
MTLKQKTTTKPTTRNKRLHFLILIATFGSIISACKKKTDSSPAAPTAKVEFTDNPAPGTILAAPYLDADGNSGKLWIMDNMGNVIKSKKTAGQAINFEQWQVNGQLRYTYVEQDNKAYHIPNIGYIPGTAVVLDKDLNELQRIRLLPFNGRTTNDVDVVDSHDFILLDDNHYITEAFFQKTVNNIPAELHPAANCQVVDNIIQEVQNGKVIWEWDAASYPEFYSISMYDNVFSDPKAGHDYLHLNSMFIDPRDNNLIVSFRHANQIIKINRTTGNIMWRLGGKNSDFPITADEVFLKQHHVTLTDSNSTLLIYDNGDPTLRPYSRILEFKLDEMAHTVTGFKSFNVPGGIFTDHMGSVQKQGDNYFICTGNVPYIMEVNYKTGKESFRMNLGENSYRAFKY